MGRPGVPASLTATAGDGEVALAWSAPADDGGAPVTGYEYRYAAGDAVPGETPWQSAGLNFERTETGLTNGRQYAFEVRALSRVGPGEAAGMTATPFEPLTAEPFASAPAVAEGEAVVIGVRRSGGLAHAAHAYVGVTDSAVPGVGAAEEGRADGLGRRRLEFAAGAAEATVAVTVAFDGGRRQDRVLTATLESVEVEIGGVARAYELAEMPLKVRVTEGDAELSAADARGTGRERGARLHGEPGPCTRRAGAGGLHDGGRLGSVGRGLHGGLGHAHDRGGRARGEGRGDGAPGASPDGRAGAHSCALERAERSYRGRGGDGHDRPGIGAARGVAGPVRADGVGPCGAGDRATARGRASAGAGDGRGRRLDGLSVEGLVSGALPSGGLLRGVGDPASAVEDMARRLAAPALAASGASGADPGTPGLLPGTWGGTPGTPDRESFGDAGEALRRAVLPDFGFRLPGAEEALLGSSFHVEGGAQEAAGGGSWAAWGDVAATRFEGAAGGLALDGDVVTARWGSTAGGGRSSSGSRSRGAAVRAPTARARGRSRAR